MALPFRAAWYLLKVVDRDLDNELLYSRTCSSNIWFETLSRKVRGTPLWACFKPRTVLFGSRHAQSRSSIGVEVVPLEVLKRFKLRLEKVLLLKALPRKLGTFGGVIIFSRAKYFVILSKLERESVV